MGFADVSRKLFCFKSNNNIFYFIAYHSLSMISIYKTWIDGNHQRLKLGRFAYRQSPSLWYIDDWCLEVDDKNILLLSVKWYQRMSNKFIEVCLTLTHEPVVIQWQSSLPGIKTLYTLECHWRNNCWLPVRFQCDSSGLPVVFQCVPKMQINTGSPLGHHCELAPASVVPVASQYTCGSSGFPMWSNHAN